MSRQPPVLARRIGPAGAVALGLGGMLGTGVFVALGPATSYAGALVWLSLLAAAVVASCNATSAARLAAADPVSGGAYRWGNTRLGPGWGLLAGWCFVVGKTASAGAAALAIGAYVAPSHPRLLAGVVVLLATALDVRGVHRTVTVSAVLVAAVVAVLVAVSVVGLVRGNPHPSTSVLIGERPRLVVGFGVGQVGAVLAGAGTLFLAFAGYARIATLGEEVRDPRRTIPRAVGTALVVALALYALVLAACLRVLGVFLLGASVTPVGDMARDVGGTPLQLVVRLAAVAAAGAVLLGVLAGTSRTMLAMARDHQLPDALVEIHPTWGTPYVAQLVAGLAALLLVLVASIGAAIAVSAGTVLVYYAVANAAAFRLPRPGSVWPRVVAVTGLVGCAVLAAALLLVQL